MFLCGEGESDGDVENSPLHNRAYGLCQGGLARGEADSPPCVYLWTKIGWELSKFDFASRLKKGKERSSGRSMRVFDQAALCPLHYSMVLV